jgi:hypothetical protein
MQFTKLWPLWQVTAAESAAAVFMVAEVPATLTCWTLAQAEAARRTRTASESIEGKTKVMRW